MDTNERIGIDGVLAPLRDLGWRPGAILDIGIATGTKGLYSVWPDVDICLVEPSPKSLVYMEQIAARYPKVHIYNVGASDHTGEVKGLMHEQLVNVSFAKTRGGNGWEETSFRMMTCDDIVADAGLKGPFVYKLDTDTHEKEVLRGSSRTLAQSEICILEINVFNGFRGRATPDEMWRAMLDNGFVLFDIAAVSYAPTSILRTMDLVFIRAGGELFEAAFRNSGKGAETIQKRAKEQRRAKTHNLMIE
jgi:FkbM family methyltransferase